MLIPRQLGGLLYRSVVNACGEPLNLITQAWRRQQRLKLTILLPQANCCPKWNCQIRFQHTLDASEEAELFGGNLASASFFFHQSMLAALIIWSLSLANTAWSCIRSKSPSSACFLLVDLNFMAKSIFSSKDDGGEPGVFKRHLLTSGSSFLSKLGSTVADYDFFLVCECGFLVVLTVSLSSFLRRKRKTRFRHRSRGQDASRDPPFNPGSMPG